VSAPGKSCVGYIRVSSTGQAEDGKDGPRRQESAIKAYCKSRRLELCALFQDLGISGRTALEQRPGLSSALRHCVESGVGIIVVEKSDRLARHLVTSELAIAAFAKVGVDVVTTDGHSLTAADDDPSRLLVRQLLGAVAQHDRGQLVARLKAARDAKAARGEHAVGAYRFGQHPERPHEGAVLERLRELRRRQPGRKRATYAQVAERATQEGLQSRTGAWTASRVRDALAS
jgi:DNA invertase Pin-like site-specific DNA recombinase